MRRFSLLCSLSLLAFAASPAWADGLTDALSSAYQKNPRIQAERAQLEAVDEGVAQAISGYRPNLSASYESGKHRTAFDGGDWAHAPYSNQSLSLTQPLFRGGATVAGFNAAKQRMLAGRKSLDATEQQVLIEAVAAYMEVVAAHAILELSENNQQVLEQQLKAAKERFEVGEVTRTDVAQADARLSDAKAQCISAQGALEVAKATFERVIGEKPAGNLAIPEKLPQLPATLEDALEKAIHANPALLAALHTEKSTRYDTYTREAALLPQVSLVGSLARQDGSGTGGDSKLDTDSIGVSVKIPLYQAGAEYSQIRAAESTERRQKHLTTDTRRGVEEEVTKAWQAVQTARASIESRKDQIDAAEIALRGVKQEQEYGARTVLDVLDAEQELFSARTNYIRTQKEHMVATYQLAMHLGEMTPNNLKLNVKSYDPTKHYDGVKWQPIGF